MTKCAETEQLVQWLQQSGNPNDTRELENHLRECSACQDRLKVLTDEPSLVHKMSAPSDLNSASAPQLAAMQKRIATLAHNEFDVSANAPQTKVDTIVLSREETTDDEKALEQELADFTDDFPTFWSEGFP